MPVLNLDSGNVQPNPPTGNQSPVNQIIHKASLNVDAPIDRRSGYLDYGAIRQTWGQSSNSEGYLFIFSPRILSPQYVRPYVLNFNDSLIGELVGRQYDASIFSPSAKKSDAILNAILPTAYDGIYQVRTNELSCYYTFMLIKQSTRNVPSMDPYLRAPSPIKRQILSGYFLEEPFNARTIWSGRPTMNLNAVMVFTHNSTFHITPAEMNRADLSIVNMNHNADNVNRTSQQMIAPGFGNNDGNSLYMMRPMDLNNAAELTKDFGSSSVDGMENASLDAIAGIRGGDASVPLACALKAPMTQLNHICGAARDCSFANLYETTNTNSLMNPFLPSQDDPDGYSKHLSDMFRENLQVVDLGPMVQEGRDIDSTTVIPLGQLDQMMHLKVMPFITETQASCELTGQDEVSSHKSVMSSMLSSTISSMLPGFNLGGLSFSYYSYRKNDFALSQNGTWIIHNADALLPNVGMDGIDHGLQACVTMFEKDLENNLFPIIKASGGEFELHVQINSFSVSLINLVFMDERGMSANPTGYWETNNCFNNFTNPLLAGRSITKSNIDALASFKNAAIAAATDPRSIGF